MSKAGEQKQQPAQRQKWILRLLFFVYILMVIKVFIFKYPAQELRAIVDTWEKGVILEGLDTANFTPLKTIKMYIDYSYMLNSFENLVGNVAVFIPFGYLLPVIKRSARSCFVLIFYAFMFSLGIELFQLFSAFGAFDVDDLLLNTAGAVLGYLVFIVNRKIFKFQD